MLQPMTMGRRSPLTRKWEPLVHGRTYEVDYRSNLLAVPAWFEPEDITRVMPFILGTFDTFLVKDLPGPVHWSVFKNEHYCVVGLTCMAHRVSEDMNRDVGNRVLPVFLGYISREIKKPMLPRMEFGKDGNPKHVDGQFSQLYKYARDRWYEKSWQAREIYRVEDTFELEIADYPFHKDLVLNTEEGRITLWPVLPEKESWSLARDKGLWAAASHHPGPVSLCLGLSRQGTAIAGPFLNASAYDVHEQVTVDKPVKEPPVIPRPTPGNLKDSPPSGTKPRIDQSPRPAHDHRQEAPNRVCIILENIVGPPLKVVGFFQELWRDAQKLIHDEEEASQQAPDYKQPQYQQGPYPESPNIPAPKESRQGSKHDEPRYSWAKPDVQQEGDLPSQPREVQNAPSAALPPKRDWFGASKDESGDTGKDAPKEEQPAKKPEGAPKRDWFGASTQPLRDETSEDVQEKQKEDSLEKQTDN